jgi:hypothetical protein
MQYYNFKHNGNSVIVVPTNEYSIVQFKDGACSVNALPSHARSYENVTDLRVIGEIELKEYILNITK